MNIDEMTVGEVKALVAMLGGSSGTPPSAHVGEKCIIRTYASGVHFGTVAMHSGRQVELTNARRLWRWDVKPHGVSLSEVAIHGPVGSRSKICETVPTITLLDALEIIPASKTAALVIEAAEVIKS